MTPIPQYEFDFQKAEAARQSMEQWESQEAAQAAQWTQEAITCIWALGQASS